MKRRILALLLVAVMMASFTVVASAATYNTDDPKNPTNDGAWRDAAITDTFIYTWTNFTSSRKWQGSEYLKSVYIGGDSNNKFVGWYKDQEGNFHYFDNTGVAVTNKWVGDYYLTDTGIMATNQWIGNYYVGDNGKYIPNAQYSGWRYTKRGWTYYLPSGVQAKNGWYKIKWIAENTTRENGVTAITGKEVATQEIKTDKEYWYYFNSKGYLIRDAWVDGTYHVGKDGIMDTNTWIYNANGWNYYVDANGKWIKNYAYQGEDTEFVERGIKESASGVAYIVYTDGSMYFFHNEWYNDGTYDYYFNADGYMVKNQWVGDYFVDENGHLVKADDSHVTYWTKMDAFTHAVSGTKIYKIPGQPYFVDESGKAVTNTWVANGTDWLHIGSNYKLDKETWVGQYYVNGNGAMLTDTWVGEYYLGHDGRVVE
jgi:glucan-binding YG repeat protein